MSNHRSEDLALAKMFAALSNPNRLALFQRLCTCCAPGTSCAVDDAVKLCVGELGDGLDIAPSTLSHHLKTLSNAGLIQTARSGKQVQCWVEPEVLTRLSSFFALPLPTRTPCGSGDPNV